MLSIFKKLEDKPKLADLSEQERNSLMASILVECAKQDGNIDDKEIIQIKTIFSNKFKLDELDIEELVARAVKDSENRVELYSITKNIREIFSHDEILDLFVNMWEIILIDDIVDDFESNLMSRLTGLFHITGRESAEAKKTAKQNIEN